MDNDDQDVKGTGRKKLRLNKETLRALELKEAKGGSDQWWSLWSCPSDSCPTNAAGDCQTLPEFCNFTVGCPPVCPPDDTSFCSPVC